MFSDEPQGDQDVELDLPEPALVASQEDDVLKLATALNNDLEGVETVAIAEAVEVEPEPEVAVEDEPEAEVVVEDEPEAAAVEVEPEAEVALEDDPVVIEAEDAADAEDEAQVETEAEAHADVDDAERG